VAFLIAELLKTERASQAPQVHAAE